MFKDNIRFLRKRAEMTQRELADKLGYKSSAAINKWEMGENTPPYKTLEKLSKIFGVTPDDMANKDLQNDDTMILNHLTNVSVPATRALPIIGNVCAGDGCNADPDFAGYFFIDNSIRADCCLQVRGNSMAGAGIYNNDIAFIRKDWERVDGEIYAVCIKDDNEAMLKTVFWKDGGVFLTPQNKGYEPLFKSESEVYIIGSLVGVYHPHKSR